MELCLGEQHNGITVVLTVRIDAAAAAHPIADAQCASIDLLEHERGAGELLDQAHPELLKLLRQARQAAEQSLAWSVASALASQNAREGIVP